MNERMDEEKLDRILKLGQLKDNIYEDIETQNNHIDKFQKHTSDALADMKNGIVEELRTRLDHQDEMLENLGQFIRTFQNTLKIIGKDV